jgi:hypothetical protein
VYGATSADEAVASLNATVQAAMDEAIPRGPTRKSKFPFWYSSSLRYYIVRKIAFTVALKRNKRITIMTNSLSIASLLKALL